MLSYLWNNYISVAAMILFGIGLVLEAKGNIITVMFDTEGKKKLAEAIKGMQVESWEVRERSNGTRKVYVRFTQKEPVVTVDVNQSEE